MHSSCSDGLLSVQQLLERIQQEGITHFSLTDHDTAAGISQMETLLSTYPELHFLPGTELSVGTNGHIHLLIYGQVLHPEVLCLLNSLFQLRQRRFQRMLEQLKSQGFAFPQDSLLRLAQTYPGRLNLARELVKLGYAPNVRQAICRYLLEGKCGFVAYDAPSASECLRLLKPYPVIPVLAHPMKLKLGSLNEVFLFIESLIPYGLRGVECFHPSINARLSRALESFARSRNLFVTGGSDFHGEASSHSYPGCTDSLWLHKKEDTQNLFQSALNDIGSHSAKAVLK